jgi:UDP:flavonoid glycosyltransferase YjiC (YdhE family)
MPTESTPSRIVIATFGSLGDLHPFLALGLELRRRGHHVILATAPHYQERIEAFCLPFEAIGPPVSPEDPELLHRLMRTARGPEFLFRKVFLPHLPQLYADLERVTRGADLLIASEVVFAAPILADKIGIPWVSVLLSPIAFLSAHDPSVLPPLARLPQFRGLPPVFHRTLFDLGSLATRHWAAPMQDFRRSLGLAPAKNPILRSKLGANLILAMFSKHFASPQPDWPPQTVQTGFAFFDQRAGQPLTEPHQQTLERIRTFLEAGERPIIFTLGSAAVHVAGDFFHVSAATAHRLGVRAILIAPQPEARFLAAANILVIPYADYRTLFPHAAAIVHQGGIGTTSEVLRAGIPSLVVPFNFDQPDNAARAVRLGVAVQLPRRKYNRRHSYYALHRLLRDEGLRDRAIELGKLIRQEKGTSEAVNEIESLLSNMRQESLQVR